MSVTNRMKRKRPQVSMQTSTIMRMPNETAMQRFELSTEGEALFKLASRGSIPEDLARLAHERYEEKHSQSFNRLWRERGGMSFVEMLCYLFDEFD